MTDNPEWLSSAEAANLLGVTTRTLYRFIDLGELPAYRFGRVIRLQALDVFAFIESRRIEPGALGGPCPGPPSTDDDDDGDAPALSA
jgi:excisionase family DNA binding protein